jgi:hypothetical protein
MSLYFESARHLTVNKTIVLTEECDICMVEEDIFSRSAHKAVFGHTRSSLALLRDPPLSLKCAHTFCFLLWHSTQEVLSFSLPSTNFELRCWLLACMISDMKFCKIFRKSKRKIKQAYYSPDDCSLVRRCQGAKGAEMQTFGF